MDLQKFKTDTRFFGYFLMGLGIIFLALFLFVFGLAAIFFIVFIGWAIFIFYYLRFLVTYSFTARIVAAVVVAIITLVIFSWAYNNPSFNEPKSKSAKSTAAKLVDCSSKPDAPLSSVDGLTYDLYSGILDTKKGSPEPTAATKTRTFSLKALTDKTSAESFYFQVRPKELTAGLKGYNELMEVCNTENKGSSSYITKNYSGEAGAVKDDNVTARASFFHGGKYILEPGDYRVDGYIWNRDSKKWVLVARETGLKITE